MAAELKTKATTASVDAYFDAIADPARREDCRALAAILRKASGHEAAMWGTAIVGFGSYHYKYESGHEGDACEVGFASRKDSIAMYFSCSSPARETLLAKLGKFKNGKGCVNIKRLADIDTEVLAAMAADAVQAVRKRYPKAS
jgi:hypothetical protein